MKKFTTLFACLIALSCASSALAYQVPSGNYVGTGTWFDNQGASGTLTANYDQGAESGGVLWAGQTVSLSDGRVYSGNTKFVIVNDGNMTLIKKLGFTVGTSFCSDTQCATNVRWSLSDVANEIAIYDAEGNLFRVGSVAHRSGRTTSYQIHMKKNP